MKFLPQTALWTLVLTLFLFGCSRTSDEEKLRTFITAHVKEVEPLLKSAALAGWNATATGEKKYYDESAALGFRLGQLASNPSDYALLKGIKERGSVRIPSSNASLSCCIIPSQ